MVDESRLDRGHMKGKSTVDVDQGQTELVAADVLRRRLSAGDLGNCRSLEERCHKSASQIDYHDGLPAVPSIPIDIEVGPPSKSSHKKAPVNAAPVVTAIKAAAVSASMGIAAEGMPPTVITPCTAVPAVTGLPTIAPNGTGNELFRVGLQEAGLPSLSLVLIAVRMRRHRGWSPIPNR
jgi:hypothetical protein